MIAERLAPPEPAHAAELRVAIEAAQEAGRIQVERFERLEHVVKKSEKDVVTEADHLSEAAIIATVRRTFPDDLFLAEESGHSGAARGKGPTDGSAAEGAVGPGHRIWIVDPLDGTVNYANGIPHFCVSVALAVGGRPTVGVVLDPLRGELYAAVAGQGAWLDGRPIRHSAKPALGDGVISLALPASRWALRDARIRKAVRVTRSMGSASLGLAWVANNRFDAFVQLRGLSLWDVAAAGLIVEESGVVVTDVSGGPWFELSRPSRGTGIVAAPAEHHGTLIALLR